jgi:hypothetical protein
MKNLSLVSSIQIYIDINNNRKNIYKFATFLYRSQQQAPCVTLCFINTNILVIFRVKARKFTSLTVTL